jgi:MoxR-like ATPase
VLGAKARALLNGRSHATVQDIEALAPPVLRHRILLNYKAEAEGISVEDITKRLLARPASAPEKAPAKAMVS